MKTAIITPAICKNPESDYEGTVEFRPPLIEERFEYFDKASLNIDENGNIDLKPKDGIKLVRSLAPELKKHLVKVDITRKSDAEKLTSYEDLAQDPDCMQLIIDLCMFLLQGFKPSKNLKPF
jgi:hypothetical protein